MEQAGFRPGKSYTSQVLNLTPHIEDGYQRGIITEVAIVDLTAAIQHRITHYVEYSRKFCPIGDFMWN